MMTLFNIIHFGQ